MAIYAVSDIHGYMNLFLKGLEEINFSDDDYLYVIGDAIDRGPDGIRLLRYIKEKDNMDLLIGNHEYLMLNSVSFRGLPFCTGSESTLWLDYNGGNITFEAYKELKERERKDLLEWLRSRILIKKLEIDGKTIILTHSNYKPEFEGIPYSELYIEDVWNIVWQSMFRREIQVRIDNIYKDYDATFVTGHVPVFRARDFWYKEGVPADEENVLAPLFAGNLIDIDGGCAAGTGLRAVNNGLLFLRLDDMKFFGVPMKKDTDMN